MPILGSFKDRRRLVLYKADGFIFHRDFSDLPAVIYKLLFKCEKGMVNRGTENFFDLLICQSEICFL